MSSRFDDNDASLAIDSTRSTYAETGRQRGAWWLMKLRNPIDVDSITIDGQMSILQSKVYIRLVPLTVHGDGVGEAVLNHAVQIVHVRAAHDDDD